MFELCTYMVLSLEKVCFPIIIILQFIYIENPFSSPKVYETFENKKKNKMYR